MTLRKILVDTGPLVAFLNKNDQHHEWVLSQYAAAKPPLFTCEAVLSEACFLLRRDEKGATHLLSLIERELLKLPFRIEDESISIQALMKKYRNVPMSFADACLVRMSEQIASSSIFTLDSDFRIYRKNGRQVIPAIMPGGI